MNEIKWNGEKMGMGFEQEDISELINSLHNIGRAIRKIEKQLGIKETPLPMIESEDNVQ